VGGRPFDALKFRTVSDPIDTGQDDDTENRLRRGLPVRQNPHVTPLGRFLIRFSLDELPQLLNVVFRQMSLVGPYKIDPRQLSLYGERQLVLFTVRPGITGVCQVHGRGELTVEERSLLDAEYVRTYTIGATSRSWSPPSPPCFAAPAPTETCARFLLAIVVSLRTIEVEGRRRPRPSLQPSEQVT